MSPRLHKLLARERDGDLTSLEREELERLSRLDPAVRRERAAWAEVERLLGAPAAVPAFRAHRLARRIADQAKSRPRPVRVGYRWVFALAACGALAVVTVDDSPPEPKQEVTRVAKRAVQPPVEVRLHGLGEGDPEPIDIRF